MHAQALVDAGNSEFRRGNISGAITHYRAALAADSCCARALYNLGVALQAAGRLDEAIDQYALVPKGTAEHASALLNWGSIVAQRGDFAFAFELFVRAASADARAAAHNLARLGDLAIKAQHLERATRAFLESARLGSSDGHVGLALIAMKEGRLEAAVQSLKRALEISPSHAVAHYNAGVALQSLARHEEAIVHLEAAIASDPQNTLALTNLGEAMRGAGRGVEAESLFRRALTADPSNTAALNNLATCLMDDGHLQAAEELFLRAVSIRHDLAQAHVNLGVIALHRAHFREGWARYEQRLEIPAIAPRLLQGVARFQSDTALRPRRLAVLKEQGIGDQILFSTLLPEFSGSSEVTVEVDPRLVNAYRRSLPGFVFAGSRSELEKAGPYDAQIPIGSLARLLRPSIQSFDSQPLAIWMADAARIDQVPPRKRDRRIAISWRSVQPRTRQNVERRKSLPLALFGGFADSSTELLDVQYGEVEAERHAFDERYRGLRVPLPFDAYGDLEGVLAGLATSDLVVTASNVTAHLAGALGRRTWLVYLGANPVFHYWVPGPDGRSLWYPSVEIVTHPSWTTWEHVLEAVAARWRSEN